jgi:hypothetical protein
MPKSFELPADANGKVTQLFRYWQTLRRRNGLPGRSDFDPLHVPRLLPHIWLVDVARQPTRLRYRLVGAAVGNVLSTYGVRVGAELSDAVTDPSRGRLRANLVMAADRGEPRWYRQPLIADLGDSLAAMENLALPLATDGKVVDVLLCLSVFYDHGGQEILPSRMI